MSRYPSYDVARFDQQFAETPYERQERQRKARERAQASLTLANAEVKRLRAEYIDACVEALKSLRGD